MHNYLKGVAAGAAVFLLAGAGQPVLDLAHSFLKATGGLASRTLSDRATDLGLNVMEYGAVGDGVTDDAPAINAAMAVVHALPVGSNVSARLYFPPGHVFLIKETINLTNLFINGFTIEGAGSAILCQTNGTPCMDGLNLRFANFHRVSIVGSAVNPPNIGIQTGIGVYPGQSEGNEFDHVIIVGTFTPSGPELFGAAMLNVISETTKYDHLIAWNNSTTPNAYNAVWDGFNHGNVQSRYMTTNMPVDITTHSFNNNQCNQCDFRNSGGGNGIWLGGTYGLRFRNSYIGDSGATGPNYAVVAYGEGNRNNDMLKLQVHMETSQLTAGMLISGTNANPLFYSFATEDFAPEWTTSFFKLDTGITSASFYNADIDFQGYQPGAVLFDDPTKYTFSGVYHSQTTTGWNPAATTDAILNIGQKTGFGVYGVGSNLAAQQPDNTTTGGNARGANAVDWQQTRTDARQVASGANATVGGGNANAANAQYATVAGGSGNSASGTGAAVPGGQGNIATGQDGVALGLNATDHARWASVCHSAGALVTPGDAQSCFTEIRGTTNTTAAVRLTGSGVAANTINCVNPPDNTFFEMKIEIVAFDHSTGAASEAWPVWSGVMHRASGAGSTTVSMSATPTPITSGTVTGSAVSASADTTNGCLNLTFTPPNGNTDTWNVVARVETTEVQ